MKLVNIIDASTDWKKSISFSDDEFSTLEVKQVKLAVATEKKEKVSFIFKGIALEDETTLRSLVSHSTFRTNSDYFLNTVLMAVIVC